MNLRRSRVKRRLRTGKKPVYNDRLAVLYAIMHLNSYVDCFSIDA
jgi:hypothetical protein